MKNENLITHRRYYIYRHTMVDGNQVMEYRTYDGWKSDFEQALLESDLTVARQMAKSCKAVFPQRYVDFNVCIGAVDCTISGFFAPEIIA